MALTVAPWHQKLPGQNERYYRESSLIRLSQYHDGICMQIGGLGTSHGKTCETAVGPNSSLGQLGAQGQIADRVEILKQKFGPRFL